MDIGSKIKELRIKKDLTLEQIGEAVGVNKATVMKWENGMIKNMRRDKIAKLAEVLGTTPAYLIGWDEPLDNIPGIMPIRKKTFPLLGNIACGEPTYAEEQHETWIEATETIDADFCIRASGDSMNGAHIEDGDIVFIKQMPVVDNGRIAAVCIGDETTLKYCDYRPETATLILTPANPAYRPQIYTGDQLNAIRILGLAVKLQKDLIK